MDDAAAARRAARAAWPMRRVELGDEPSLVDATPSERVAMVHALTMDAWAMSGRPIPDYPRRKAPGLLRKAP